MEKKKQIGQPYLKNQKEEKRKEKKKDVGVNYLSFSSLDVKQMNE